MSLNSINPPVPQASLTGASGNEKSVGHRLIRLVRSAEKQTATADELSVLLDELSETFLRRGLLGGDIEKAEKVLSSGIKSSNASRRDKKGGNKSKTSSLTMKNGDEKKYDAEGDSGAAADDINLLLSALVRLAGGNHELSTPIPEESILPCHLVIGGFNICIAALQHTIARQRHESCAQAEYELIIGVARGLLTGVCRTVKGLLKSSIHDIGAKNVIVSGFRAATLLLSLYGTKLSRNQPVLTSLRSLAWEVAVISDDTLQNSASTLLAGLPLAGIDKQAPAVLWTDGIIDGTAALYLLKEAVAPQTNTSSKGLDAMKAQSFMSDTMKANVAGWVERIEKVGSSAERILIFTSVTSALSKYIVALLRAEALIAQELTVLSAAQFPVVEMLDLLETMMSFPTFAESLYYGTKKRLRFEVVDGGFLNPHDIASNVANQVKHCGLAIFDAVLQDVSRSALLPFGKRIVKMAHTSLLTSCTVPLRHALDPTSSVRLDGKRKKWLHTSLKMRTKAINSFNLTVCTLRSNALVSPSSVSTGTRRGKSSQADKGVVLVVGCLLEQLSYDEIGNWGSTEERVSTAVAAVKAISSTLIQGGGFLSFASRSLIDSSIKTCKETFDRKTVDSLSSSSVFKLAFLTLMSNCLVTPWPDGATTSQTHDIIGVVRQLTSDEDSIVASNARSLLQLIHTMKTPRSPPLVIVTRSSNEMAAPSNGQENASAIVDRLKVAQESMHVNEAVSVVEAAAKTSKRKKERKEEEQNDIVVKTKRARKDPSADQVAAVAVETKPEPVVEISNGEQGVIEDAISDEKHASTLDDDDDEMADFFPGIVDTGPDEEEE